MVIEQRVPLATPTRYIRNRGAQLNPSDENRRSFSVLAVVVVYERGLEDVECWETLQALASSVDGKDDAHDACLRLRRILVYDNSRSPRATPANASKRCCYVHDASNGGTAAAYAYAAKMAARLQVEWILLLDHDTTLPSGFLSGATAALRGADDEEKPAALLPRVRHRSGKYVSPSQITWLGTIELLQPNVSTGRGARMTAIASGSILRLAALNQALPLPRFLWLDYVDHWIFAQLYLRGLKMVVFDQVLHHDLSNASPQTMSPHRLVSMLRGEAIFQGLLGPAARVVYPFRVAWRLVRLARVNFRLVRDALLMVFRGSDAKR